MQKLNGDILKEMMKCFSGSLMFRAYDSVRFTDRREVRGEVVLFPGGDGAYGRIIIYYDAEDFNDKFNLVKDIMEEMTPGYRTTEHRFGNPSLDHVSFTLNTGSEKECQQTQKVQEGKGSSWKSLLAKGG